jgi:luciferase family oxidoreductase group 1
MAALDIYRSSFRPSAQLDRPYAMIGLNVVAAETDAEARRLFTSQQQSFTNLQRGRPGPLRPPIDDIDEYWTPAEKMRAQHMLAYAIAGGPETVRAGIQRMVEATEADELMVVSAIYDHAARVRSYEILAAVA